MLITDHYALLARYNQWMNQKLYAVCAGIPDVGRKKDLGAFFGSVHGTLNHLLFGDTVWMARFTGTAGPTEIIAEMHADFGALRKEQAAMDRRILDWAGSLTPEWLAAPLRFTSNVDRKTRVMPAWTLVAHLFNHQTHHRGQLTTLIKQLGRDPGITDIPWLPEFESAIVLAGG
jgi:uncharacterized damage-inducible protein DinB